MAVTVTLDSVEDTGADVELLTSQGSLVRGGYVDGITGDPATFLAQVFAAVNVKVAPGTLYPGSSAAAYSRLVVRASGQDAASIQLYYTKDSGFQPTAFQISSRAYLGTIATKRILSTGDSIYAEWQNPAGGSGPANYIRKSVTDSAQFPMREVTVQGIKYGQATDAVFEKYEGSIGYANLEMWRNRAKGFWLCNDGGVDASPMTGTYGFHLSAITRNICDWSESRDLEDAQGFILSKKTDRQALFSLDYSQGIIDQENGCVRWGQFPLTSFTSLFGFNGLGGTPRGQPISPDGTSPTNL